MTSPLWPLAHLGLARAAVLQGDTTKAKQYYDEFFRLWKDADADLPVLLEAKKDRTYAEGPTNFSLSSGYRHEPLAETNDKLKFVGHLRQFLRKS